MTSVEAVAQTRRNAVRTLAVPLGIVAVVAIALAAASFVKFESTGRAVVAAIFCAALTVLAAIDLERRIIPNRIVIPAGILVLLGNFAAQPGKIAQWAIAAVATLAVGVGISLATRGGIGMGDAKLGFLLGAGLGWNILGALIWASGGIFVAAIIVLAQRGMGARKDALPFGPFLALGAVIALFLS